MSKRIASSAGFKALVWREQRQRCYGVFLAFELTSVAKSAPISDSKLKNLLAAIRQNRSTQADFQEQRVIRLLKKPVVSSGTVWFQPPNKFRREVKGNSPSVTVSDGRELWIYYPNFKSAERYPLGKGSPLDATVAAINSRAESGKYRNQFQHFRHEKRQWT
jgi:outer membrane lipoprotein-sorting protein